MSKEIRIVEYGSHFEIEVKTVVVKKKLFFNTKIEKWCNICTFGLISENRHISFDRNYKFKTRKECKVIIKMFKKHPKQYYVNG